MFLLFSLKVVRLSLLISFQVKVEDIETALDGEVTKIEESSFDAKGCTITVESISTVDEKLVLKSLYKKIAENQKAEEAMKTTAAKLSTVQGELERSKSQAQEKLEIIENDLQAARMRENEVIEKLKSTEEQLQEQGKVFEKATARSIELESLYRTLTRESEQRLQEALANFTRRDSEAKSLREKLTSLENQVKSCQDQLAEANERYAAVKEELNQIVVKLASSENANKDLKQKILDAEGKTEQYVAEMKLLANTNLQLTEAHISRVEAQLEREVKKNSKLTQELASHMSQLSDLETKLSTVSSEKNVAVEKLQSARKDMEYLRQKLREKEKEKEKEEEKKDCKIQ
ncbi:unnamed protein product [Fraxinus pennsylvanica]|uniref:Uncharacterized protein n=1 Tax=Fraxinus pennsylvanica TaxID=56036 RepID=A0AAD2ABM9_9LAMI|nr:unnamed protein product [Fraxinus pennsylvanica]